MERNINLKDAKYKEVIEFILSNYHDNYKKELPIIKNLAYTILRVHYGDSGDTLSEVYKLFGKISYTLELLFIKKERVLFFLIGDYERKPSHELLEEIKVEVNSIKKEYNTLMETLKELRGITDEYTMPSSGCPTYDKTYRKLEELEANIINNIEIENAMYGRLGIK